MIKEIFFVLWFFLPAGMGNVSAFLSGKFPGIGNRSYPLDFHKKFRGKRILGDHKTIRGIICGILVGMLCVWLEILCYRQSIFLQSVIPINYTAINPVLLGSLAGLGALLGDAVESFFKRQKHIQPGKSWFPFDQIDYILGGIALTALYIRLSILQYILLFIVWFLLHPLTNFLGYVLRLKKEKF